MSDSVKIRLQDEYKPPRYGGERNRLSKGVDVDVVAEAKQIARFDELITSLFTSSERERKYLNRSRVFVHISVLR